ncbi:glycosyltransferase family 2 protein [Patescibacteria group bacterium AH-259-L07]|nr:glycosyltransferase family 2 protein [Patescibacteria group bacterium AH-259-L07]
MNTPKKTKIKPHPLVSIIIPTYNQGDLLPRALRSVLKQTFQDFEIIIVDDGSVDNTKKIVEEFQKKDGRIKYFWQKNSGGAAKPKNVGIRNSLGEYIAILDSDDEWFPQKLENQINLFKTSNNSRLGFVSCNAIYVYEKNKKQIKFKIPRYKKVLEKTLADDYMGSGSGMVIKKSVFKNVGLFDENLKSAQDAEMRIRMASKYNFDFVDDFLFKYYIHENSITNKLSLKERERDLDYIFKKHKKYFENNPKIYSNKLRYDGTRYVLNGDLKQARKSLICSIKLNPLNYRGYIYFFCSFFGTRFYSYLAKVKMKIKSYI